MDISVLFNRRNCISVRLELRGALAFDDYIKGNVFIFYIVFVLQTLQVFF